MKRLTVKQQWITAGVLCILSLFMILGMIHQCSMTYKAEHVNVSEIKNLYPHAEVCKVSSYQFVVVDTCGAIYFVSTLGPRYKVVTNTTKVRVCTK